MEQANVNIVIDIINLQQKIGKLHSDHQQKYDFYLMSLSGAIIALIVHFTIQSVFSYALLLVLAAGICEVISGHFGIRKQQFKEKMLEIQHLISFDFAGNIYGKIDKDEFDDKLADHDKNFKIEEGMSQNSARSQYVWFCIGIMFFLTWHSTNIYRNTINQERSASQQTTEIKPTDSKRKSAEVVPLREQKGMEGDVLDKKPSAEKSKPEQTGLTMPTKNPCGENAHTAPLDR